MVQALKTYTIGLKWEEIGSKKPSTGTEIENDVLSAALQDKVEFKKEEWESFQVANLSSNRYIRAGNRYFKPADTDVNYMDISKSLRSYWKKAPTSTARTRMATLLLTCQHHVSKKVFGMLSKILFGKREV